MSGRSSDDWRYEPGQKLSPHIRKQLEQRRRRFADAWRRDPARETALIILFAVAVAAIATVAFNLKEQRFDQAGGSAYDTFWMESAQRFRYVRQVADDSFIPQVDRRMQAPDGYPPWSDTVLQEVLYGSLARRAEVEPDELAPFVRQLTRAVSASAVLPIALLCLVVTRRRDAALLGALLWAVALPLTERGTGAALFREDLAIPILLWHLALLALWSQRPRIPAALASGIFLALALLLWKVVTFYVLMLAVFLGTAHWLGRARGRELLPGTIALLLPVVGACFLPLNLSHDSFLTSSAMLALFAVAGAMVLDVIDGARAGQGRSPRKPIVWLPIAVLLFAALRFLLPSEVGYGHAWETIAAKVQHLGFKPDDPAQLPFHARHYWTGNYESPTLRRLARDWPLMVLVALPGLVYLLAWWRPKSVRAEAERERVPPPLPIRLFEGRGPADALPGLASHFVLWLLLAFVAAYLLFRKFILLAAIPLVLLAALGFAAPRRMRRRLRGLILVGALLVGAQGWGLVPDLGRMLDLPPRPDGWNPVVVHSTSSFDELARALPEVVGEDEAVLASFVISPFILAYLDRPTVLHCFFEGDLPERYRRITEARFGDEEALWAVAREYGARWYVHEAQHLLRTDRRMSQRYVADRIDWPHDSVLVAMQLEPRRLKRFELAWENDHFRVFKVLQEGERKRDIRPDPYRPSWNRPLFEWLFGDPFAPIDRAEAFPLSPRDLLYTTLASTAAIDRASFDPSAGSVGNATTERALQEALRMAPYLVRAEEMLADYYAIRDRYERVQEHRSRAEVLRRALGGRGPFPEDARPVPLPLMGE